MEVFKMNHKALDFTALTIAIIGAINWGLIGFFSFDLVAFNLPRFFLYVCRKFG